MDPNLILSNRFVESYFDQEKSLLTLHWFPSTYEMEIQEYKDLCLETIALTKQKGIQRLMNHTKDYAFVAPPELQKWISDEFKQKLKDSKLQKMAIIVPTDYVTNLAIQQTIEEVDKQKQENSYQIRYFDDPAKAKQWLFE